LSESERKLIAATLYPFGETASRGGTVPQWADEAIRRITLPQIQDRTIPPVKIVLPNARPRDKTPEGIASSDGPAVAVLSSKDGAIGSGALISNDGLVLTAAHVLHPEPIDVIFPGAGDARRFPATLVFVNDPHDVALLRVIGYRSDRWFEVA